ncbi:MAG TPA: hypothetical protein VMV61_11395 [Patescibacteria group bacterium]|nr:hypothetical protein [Patescibacteria group bacterium]
MSRLAQSRKAVNSCIDCVVTVDCPAHHGKAEITVARWKASNGQYTPWTVVDCSLLPAGQICCHVDCLNQLTDISRLGRRKRTRAT